MYIYLSIPLFICFCMFNAIPTGRALDDVIIRAHDERGEPAVLEIQVKRRMSFTPTDPVFRAVAARP